MKKYFSIILLVGLIFLSSCSQNKNIRIESAWIRPGFVGNTTGGYFTIINPSDQSDKLVSVSGEISKRIEIHRTLIENEVMTMIKQDYIEIPEHSEIEFKPQGLHIMLVDLTEDIDVGDQIELILHFEKAGLIKMIFDVKNMDK